MKVIEFKRDNTDVLRTFDLLRAEIESGKVIGFVAVGITPELDCLAYMANSAHLTFLHTYGAVAHLQHCLMNGQFNEDSKPGDSA